MPTLVPAPSRVPKGRTKMPVLIADRDPGRLARASRDLRRRWYEVAAARGGVECLELLHQRRYGLLVLQLDLPWGGGDGVLALLRDDPARAHLPVILACTRPDAIARRHPVAALLKRPYSPSDLRAAMSALSPSGQAERASDCAAPPFGPTGTEDVS